SGAIMMNAHRRKRDAPGQEGKAGLGSGGPAAVDKLQDAPRFRGLAGWQLEFQRTLQRDAALVGILQLVLAQAGKELGVRVRFTLVEALLKPTQGLRVATRADMDCAQKVRQLRILRKPLERT